MNTPTPQPVTPDLQHELSLVRIAHAEVGAPISPEEALNQARQRLRLKVSSASNPEQSPQSDTPEL